MVMATSYLDGNNNNNNTSDQGGGLQTLHLMNPNYLLPFSASHNSHSSPTSNTNNILFGNDQISGFHAFSSVPSRVPRYTLWGGSIVNQDQTPNSSSSSVAAAVPTVTAAAVPISNNSGHAVADVEIAAAAETGSGGHQQGLSLTLSSQQHPAYSRSFPGEMEGLISPASRGLGGNTVVMGSKYLKAAQEILDEVVNVGKGNFSLDKMNAESNSAVGGGGGGENSSGDNKQGGEVSTAQRQELQLKKSKLVSMLDEVEQRYRQYHHQMQIVISSFEQAAGYGAARSYTSLALKTISKQFRCLKDTISSQVKATTKAMGEVDCVGAKGEGSRLRYDVDHHLRQQRALQQLGMIQHNAWRPQRGLPERAVTILRAWLFEHFLHPYPKDSDKVMLAKQTGLTRSQVSNWFINARVRLWKPMVEEMYMEEIKDQEHNNNNIVQESNNKEIWSSSPPNNNNQNTSPTHHDHIISNSNNNSNSMSQQSLHSPGSILSSVDAEMKPGDRETNNNTSKFGVEIRNNHGGYGSALISMEDIGRFNNQHQPQLAPMFHGNGVSLTLGLPPSDHHQNLPLPNSQHGFLNMHNNLGAGGTNENDEFCAMNNTPPPPSSHSHPGNNTYDHSLDIQNRERLAAQFLRDFVS